MYVYSHVLVHVVFSCLSLHVHVAVQIIQSCTSCTAVAKNLFECLVLSTDQS